MHQPLILEKSIRFYPWACGRARGIPRAFVMAVVIMASAAGCGSGGDPQPPGYPASTEESVLYGGGGCAADSGCPGGICAGGSCIGFLMIPSDMARNQAGEGIRQLVARRPDAAARLSAAAAGVALDASAESFARSRAADMFRFLPCGASVEAIRPALDQPVESVRFFAARALARCGDKSGIVALESFRAHKSAPIRALADDALEKAAGM